MSARIITDLADAVPGHPMTIRARRYSDLPWSSEYVVPGHAVVLNSGGILLAGGWVARWADGKPGGCVQFVSQEVIHDESAAQPASQDDEREVLAQALADWSDDNGGEYWALDDMHGGPSPVAREIASHLVSAGFRRQASRTVTTAEDDGSIRIDEDAVEAGLFAIEGTHHFHGTTCLCGFDSHGRARSATEHITAQVRKVLSSAVLHVGGAGV